MENWFVFYRLDPELLHIILKVTQQRFWNRHLVQSQRAHVHRVTQTVQTFCHWLGFLVRTALFRHGFEQLIHCADLFSEVKPNLSCFRSISFDEIIAKCMKFLHRRLIWWNRDRTHLHYDWMVENFNFFDYSSVEVGAEVGLLEIWVSEGSLIDAHKLYKCWSTPNSL